VRAISASVELRIRVYDGVVKHPRAGAGVPIAPTPFVGRRGEVAALRRQLRQVRVLTLIGAPGVGKTRLALRAVEEWPRDQGDELCFVDLLPLTDPGLLAAEVARSLGLGDASTRWDMDGLAQHIDDARLLLLLDNGEHLLDACAVLVDSLIRACPNLRVLTTSREALHIRAETVVQVAPMPVPSEGSVSSDAVELLLARAAALAPGFAADAADRRLAATLCRRLDGIPLAIELAAGRLRTLTLEQILDRLSTRFEVLAGRDATAPAHQRTLRATLDWSRDLASEEERILWRRASAFSSGFDLDAAETVCLGAELDAGRILEALVGLVDKSIVTATREGSGMRYRMLESVRDYGQEALQATGERDAVRTRHFAYYAELCARAWEHWSHRDQPYWFDRLEAEHGNLRAALDWALDHDVEAGTAMAADLWLYWEARNHLTEGRRRLATFLTQLPGDSSARPKALWVAGYLGVAQTDLDAGLPLLHAAAEAATERGDDEAKAFATQYLGLSHLFAGELSAAEELLEHAYRRHLAVGSRTAVFALTDLAVTVMLAGEVSRALELYETAWTMGADDGDPWTLSHLLWGMGVATLLDGAVERAEALERDALRRIAPLDERSGIALCLEALAWIAAARGVHERAATLQGASAAVWASIPARLPQPLRHHALLCEKYGVERLGTARRERLYQAGRRLDRPAAVAFGLGRHAADTVPTLARPDASVLSPREREVAALVAEGLTDREIALRLVISQRTAESHVQHILAKLAFRKRTQIATWVTRRATSTP
jgi:predicted ATPase/DNA-binding CsgD family transcriptional regulator